MDYRVMKTISVRDMKAHWSDIEAQVRNGETFEVLNHGKPSVRIVPIGPKPVSVWDDHLATALPATGKNSEDTIKADREGRW